MAPTMDLWAFWPHLPSWLRYLLSLAVLGLAAFLFLAHSGTVWTWPVAFIGTVMLMAAMVQD